MSNDGETCEYVLDPDNLNTDKITISYVDEKRLNEDGVWACPYKCKNVDDDFCHIHSEKENKDGQAVTKFISDICQNSEDETVELIGAKISSLDLEKVSKNKNTSFILNHSNIDDISVEDTRFAGKINLSGSIIENIYIENSTFESDFYCEGSNITGIVNGKDSIFKDNVSFSGSFGDGDLFLHDTKFEGFADFSSINLENLNFSDSEFYKTAQFIQTTPTSSDFLNAEFKDECNFYMSEFDDGNFSDVKFNGPVDFARSSLQRCGFARTNLSEVNFRGADMSDSILVSAILNRAVLKDVDLRGAELSGVLLGDARLNENTKFLGHPIEEYNDSKYAFSTIFSHPKCVYDPDYERHDHENNDQIKNSTYKTYENKSNIGEAKSVYRTLEQLGRKHARPQLQAYSFVRRQDLQKRDYWDDATANDASFEQRLIAGARWSRAKVARATLLYGESPWRVITWSLGIIFSFALLYPLGGWMKPADGDPITYAQIASNPVEILNSLYYSTLTYTALGFGDFQPVGFGRLLTTFETGLGAVMLALLVFILGRRAAR